MARALRAVLAGTGMGGGGEGTSGARTRATTSDVAAFVEEVAGDRIRERRAELGFSAALSISSSRATIAPMRSRPSMLDVEALPAPPRVARVNLPTMVDEDEFSSRSALRGPGLSGPPSGPLSRPLGASDPPISSSPGVSSPTGASDPDDASDQDENLSALAPIAFPADTLVIDAASRESLWVGGEPTDEREALKASAAENELRQISSFPPALAPRNPEPLFEDRRGRRPVIWGAVALAVVVALVFGYGLGRGQKPVPSSGPVAPVVVGGGTLANVKAEPAKTVAPEVSGERRQGASAEPGGNMAEAAPVPQAPQAKAPTEIELVPVAPDPPREGPRAAARRTRGGHAAPPRTAEAPPSPPSPPPVAPPPPSSPPASEASGAEGRDKFNPQAI